MGYKVNEQVETKIALGISSATITYTVYDETDTVTAQTGSMSEIASTGMYTCSWTPDAAGEWTVRITATSPVLETAFIYAIGIGDGVLIHQVGQAVIYLLSEDMAATQGTDDGTNPPLTSEVSKANADESAAEADPSWSEDFNLEQNGTITIVSMLLLVEWQMKRTGGTTAYSKWQVSGDGGSTWTDVTGNLSTLSDSYVDQMVMEVGSKISTIDSGANKLQYRLCAWTDGTTVETKVRASSYAVIEYRKS